MFCGRASFINTTIAQARDNAATSSVTIFNPSVIIKVRSKVCLDIANSFAASNKDFSESMPCMSSATLNRSSPATSVLMA